MKSRSQFLTAFLFIPIIVFSQSTVKMNILDLYDQVAVPPKNVQDAYARSECTVNGDLYLCDAKHFYKRINDTVADIGNQFQKAGIELSKPTTDAVANVDPKEIQKKMATMTQAEKMEYAMAMTKKMGLGPGALAPEPDAVREAVEECNRLNKLASDDSQNAGARVEKKGRLHTERGSPHKEIEYWAASETKKLPLIDYGVDKEPGAKAVYAIRSKAMDKHIAAENDYLKVLQKQFKDLIAEQKSRYGHFQLEVSAINYGEDAKNVGTKRSLLSGQQLMMGPVQELLTMSQDATDEAVHWWTRKLNLEQQKPG